MTKTCKECNHECHCSNNGQCVVCKCANCEHENALDEFWKRATRNLPTPVNSIKPHPHGIEIGSLNRLLRDSSERNMRGFLRHTFSGIPMRAMKEILERSDIDQKKK